MLRVITVFVLMLGATSLCAATDVDRHQTHNGEMSASSDEAFIPLPNTQVFEPLRADPKEPRFFVSTLAVSSNVQNTTIGAVGFGENFGLVRHKSNSDSVWQMGISAAVFAQFDLETPSSDLMNADYVVGIPVSWRKNDWSGRVRVYHQSSHLGDEFLLREHPERVNLSFESIEVIVSHDFAGIRVYGGGEYLFHREPSNLSNSLLHVGMDWRAQQSAFDISHMASAHWVAGIDVKHWQQNDMGVQFSAKAGLEFSPLRNMDNNSRRWSLLVEYFDGPSPYGQFYQDNLRYLGVAIQLGL